MSLLSERNKTLFLSHDVFGELSLTLSRYTYRLKRMTVKAKALLLYNSKSLNMPSLPFLTMMGQYFRDA
jgi:hypothetical protein